MPADPAPRWTARRLAWEDEELGEIALPRRPMRIRSGFGSGLATRRGDPPGTVWAVGDRGPNLKVETAVDRYGLDRLEAHAGEAGAKIMPRPDLGPAIARLHVSSGRVDLVRSFPIVDSKGRPVSGLPVPEGGHARCEPALDLDGNALASDPSGLDTEGIAALADGGFWVGDEFGPSLVRLDAGGRVLRRLVPEGVELDGAAYPVEPRLPALAARRQLNRGFEALALSPDEKWLFLAFQSPLAHPDEAAHRAGRHVRLWRLDAVTGETVAQYAYPLDPPGSFRRDGEAGPVKWHDLKVSELVALGSERLLVLERASATTKIYEVIADPGSVLPGGHLEIGTRPTLEELSAEPEGLPLPVLAKRLILSTDDSPQIPADLEGMAVLGPSALLLVNDNDFGVEGAETSFWRIDFDRPLFD